MEIKNISNCINFSDSLDEDKIDRQVQMLNDIPKIWIERFIEERWQINITKKMPTKICGILSNLFIKDDIIWIKSEGIFDNQKLMYKAFAFFVDMEYAHIMYSDEFDKLIKNNKFEIYKFVLVKKELYIDNEIIFAELFKYVLETKGVNPNKKIDEIYQFVKKWVYGDVFNRKLNYIPKCINAEEYITDEQILKTYEAFNSLPFKMKKEFFNTGWIIILKRMISEQKRTVGLCDSFNKTIYVSGTAKLMDETLLHEFGHFLDHKEKYISKSDKFKEIYEKEKYYARMIYGKKDNYKYVVSVSSEYFADMFKMYLIQPDRLKYNVPKTYCFIDEIVHKWS